MGLIDVAAAPVAEYAGTRVEGAPRRVGIGVALAGQDGKQVDRGTANRVLARAAPPC